MRKVIMILSIAVVALFLSSAAFASVNDDQVTSQKIKEADGTSGQNTNAGSGVKTGHIQNDAVTTGKIVNGAVTTDKITDGSVTTGKVADGSVTDAKISGPISGSKISSTGLNADTVDGQHASAFAPTSHIHSMSSVSGLQGSLAGKSDVTHNHDTLYQQKYGKVAVIAQTGGDYTDPVTAMTNVTAWCGTPSATNPCLLKIMPGVYDIGTDTLQLLPYIDVEGSGEKTSVITSANAAGTAQGALGVEMRFLTIKNTGGLGISNSNADLSLTNATVTVSGGGVTYGINNSTSNLTLNKVSINVTGVRSVGIQNLSSKTTLRNCKINVQGDTTSTGIQSYGPTQNHQTFMDLDGVDVIAVGGAYWDYNRALDSAGNNWKVTT